MRRYTVLRDLGRSATGEPFGGAFATALRFRATADTPPAVRVDVETLDKRDVLTLGRDPDVRGLAPVMPTTLIQPVDGGSGAAATTAWGIAAVGADRSGRTGSGVTVAVLDTGIDAAHDAFAGVTLVQEDFSGSGNGDKAGHGTHCAGTVFGRDVGGTRIGVAPGVDRALIGKVLGDNGGGDSDMLFRGIHWAVSEGARVISMSLGFDFPGLVEQLIGQGVPADLATSMALEAYRANLRVFDSLMQLNTTQEPFGRGAVVVAAAGNESRRDEDPDHEIGVSIPAAAEGVVSVGALAETSGGLQVAPFSNTFPQVSGPGVDVLSAKIGGGLHPLNGTSMATPHAAGVAALWWEELIATGLPASATAVRAKLLASAVNAGFATGVDVADRGLGIVQAP